MASRLKVSQHFDRTAQSVVFRGDSLDFLAEIPTECIQLIVTSPPYNIGKEYEKKVRLEKYIVWQTKIIRECHRILKPNGSICWQVGNYVEEGEIVPLDIALFPAFNSLGMKMRNRIIWHFEHGLHCSKRFSGRYESINWFTKSDDYTFHLDPVRVPQKYPGKKYFKGPKAGTFSCNPLGKNPGDLWTIPNVKSNHVEKTDHPCQFPLELIERLILSMTDENDWVFDPFLGTGTTVIAALKNKRRGAGAELVKKYIDITLNRIQQLANGTLKYRPMHTPVFDPANAGKTLITRPWETNGDGHPPIKPQPSLNLKTS
ncbi:MAG: site-specific DNA-methyltransferase [Verrucomicrobiae bacterium]|nr:site-specific DNA-methyltransferase [Verrucomicrobiae bacterium]